jgi:putative ATPase
MTLFDMGGLGEEDKKVPETPGGTPADLPLAARVRPRNFSEFVGQEHLLGKGRVLRKAIEADQIPSMILWGPPGSGKTTLGYVVANVTKSHFSPLSAVNAGVADLRRIVSEAGRRRKVAGQRTILFIDEIHRFNKTQQDVILPYVENGVVTLIGATTENPSFEVISALLSRCRVFTLNSLTDDEVSVIVERAIKDEERGLGKLKVKLDKDASEHLILMSNGDARVALNALEIAAQATMPDDAGRRRISLKTIEEALQHRALLYDKAGDQHYDIISALHKSLRGSDVDAALYWLGRML